MMASLQFLRWWVFPAVVVALTGCQLVNAPQSTNTTNGTETNEEVPQAEATYWMEYKLKQCETAPWGSSLESDSILAYYQENFAITIYTVEVIPPEEGFIACAACGCPTGTTVSIQTDESGREILLDEEWSDADVFAAAQPTTGATVADANTDDSTTTMVVQTTTGDETTTTKNEGATLSTEDAQLRQRAERVEISLAEYYAARGSYPDDIDQLLGNLDTTGLMYTPIGSIPADYYDLAVFYSTGTVIVNP